MQPNIMGRMEDSTGSQYFSSSVCATFQASPCQNGGREPAAQLQTHQLPKHIYLWKMLFSLEFWEIAKGYNPNELQVWKVLFTLRQQD